MKAKPGETVRIQYPSSGETYNREEYGVYSYGVYERGSVLEGQTKRTFLDSFDTLEKAQAEYPDAELSGCGFQELNLPHEAPDWFDPLAAGETWSEREL